MNFKSEQGNVLVYILIAVALFAALGFAVSNMMRSSGGSIAGEKELISASEVLSYGKSLRDAVQFLRISNGCSETQLSFERQPFDGSDTDYVNASAPSDYSCHVFHPNGGAIDYQDGAEDINGGQEWIFTASNDGDNIGNLCNEDRCADLIAILPGLPQGLCREINKKLDVAQSNNYMTQENDYFDIDPFDGSYSYSARLSDSSTNDALDGTMQGCLQGKDSPQESSKYYFYQVLLVR